MKINEIAPNMAQQASPSSSSGGNPNAKIKRIKPGSEAEIDNGDGTSTIIDLKKNPSALSKSSDGKIKLMKPGTQGVDPATIIKPGDKVEF